MTAPHPGRSIPWLANPTELNQALESGRRLKARHLLAAGEVPDSSTLNLARQQDSLGTHALLRQAGFATSLLPGSALSRALDVLEAEDLADRLGLLALEQPVPEASSQGRARL